MAPEQQVPAFVVIRFPLSRYQACKNSLIKNLSVHRVYSGEVSGICRSLEVVEGSWPSDRGIAILSFRSLRDAELWKDSVPEIRQHDWLDGADFVIVPITSLPPEEKRFVQLLEFHFNDFDKLRSEYSPGANEHLLASGAAGGVVSTSKVTKVKGMWNPEYIVMNFWSSSKQFEESYKAEAYQPLKEKRCVYADTNICVFALEPLFTGSRRRK